MTSRSTAVAAAPPAFRGLWAFTKTEFLVQVHERLVIFTSIIVQVVLLIFVAILNPSLLGVALVGAIIFSMFALGQRVQNEAAYIRIDHKLHELYLASPLTPEAYFLGISIGVLTVFLPPVFLFLAIAEIVAHLSLATMALLVGASLAVWLFSCSLGYVFSTMFDDMRAIWPYASLFYNLFGVLPPVFYPIRLLPEADRPFALLAPPSAATGLLQWSMGASALTSGEVALAVLVLAVGSVGMFVIAVYWARATVRQR